MPDNSQDKKNNNISESDIKKIQKYIESVEFGSVTLYIHDGKIAQIEKSEKIKLK